MIGWTSILLASLAGLAALALPGLGDMVRQQTGSPLSWPLLLLGLVGLAFFLGRRAPRWSLGHRLSTWSATISGAIVLLVGLPAFLGQQPPREARPAPLPRAAEAPEDLAGEPRGERPPAPPLRRALADPLPQPQGEEPVFFSEREAMEAPIPGAPRRVIVRDANGDEYPFWLNPGEKLPEGLVNVDAQARMAIALGAWAEIAPRGGNGHFFAMAEINSRPVRVLIDTGASAVALSFEDAEKAGINTMTLRYTIPVATANGVVKAAPVTLRRVEIDGVLVRDVKAWVMPRGAMRGTLLGMSFLSRLREFSVRDGRLILRQ